MRGVDALPRRRARAGAHGDGGRALHDRLADTRVVRVRRLMRRGSDGRSVMTRLAVFVCTFGYVGYFPIAPGTAGSAAGLVVYALLRWRGSGPARRRGAHRRCSSPPASWSGTHAERHFGTTDPGPGVIDEVVGMLVTLFLLPVTWTVALAGFFVFRVLDVVKPYPARRFESLHGGLGHDGRRRHVGHLRQPRAPRGRLDRSGAAAVA